MVQLRAGWVRGESDVDFIVVVKNKQSKKQVEKFFGRLLEKLDKKHNLQLEKATTNRKSRGAVVNFVFRLESSAFLGVPFYVVSQDEFELSRNRVNSTKMKFLATFVGSLNTFLVSLRRTALTIYGKNLLQDIKTYMSFSDKVRLFVQQMWIMAMAFLLLDFDKKLALKHAVKASLYEEEFFLLMRHLKIHGYKKDTDLFKEHMDKKDASHLSKALSYRKSYNQINPAKDDVRKFLHDTMSFIFRVHGRM